MQMHIKTICATLGILLAASWATPDALAQHDQVDDARRSEILQPRQSGWSNFRAQPRPFDYFECNSNGNSIINAYLLTYLSDAVYSDVSGADPGFEDRLAKELDEYGATLVDFYAHPVTGSDFAIVYLQDAMIVVFRGSSSNGTEAFSRTDWVNDFANYPTQQSLGGQSMYLHFGFWLAAEAVFSRVHEHAVYAQQLGKKVWLTGHSLGGAMAEVTAARLHYEHDLAVQGLHTFGSPRVGDHSFHHLMTTPGANGIALADIKQRWVVDGDYATTLFSSGTTIRWIHAWYGSYPRWITVHYQHVGQTNQIYRMSTRFGFRYSVDYDAAESKRSASLLSLVSGGEHMAYTSGIRAETSRVLRQRNWTSIKEGLMVIE